MKKIFFLACLIFSFCAVHAYEFPRWVSQPIYVHIPEFGDFSYWMKQSFLIWEQNSNNLIRFRFVSSPSNANIKVEFVDYVTNCNNNHAVGCTHTVIRGKNYVDALVTIGIKSKTVINQNGREVEYEGMRNPSNIYGAMIHEVGHALGLGHSDNPASIMYPYDLPTIQYLTDDDKKLLFNKYY